MTKFKLKMKNVLFPKVASEYDSSYRIDEPRNILYLKLAFRCFFINLIEVKLELRVNFLIEISYT